MVTKLTIENFENEALNSNIPVLVDFYADWCGPCKMLSPTVDKMAEAYAGRIKVCKLNVDDAYPVAASFGIQSIPTLIFFKDGQVAKKTIGYMSASELNAVIEEVV